MHVNATKGTIEDLRHLSTTIRPTIHVEDVWVPDGYRVDVVMASIGKLTGALGGAPSDWQMLHQLVLSNMNALDAFTITEQSPRNYPDYTPCCSSKTNPSNGIKRIHVRNGFDFYYL